MPDNNVSAIRLVARGDKLAIIRGKLIIEPKSGNPVPTQWLKTHEKQLVDEITYALKIPCYQYLSFSTGFYGTHKSEGLTLQFLNSMDGSEAHAIFNVSLRRKRNTKHGKAGSPLTKGQFNVSAKHFFYKFFILSTQRTAIRKASIHEHMGLLKGIYFTGTVNENGKFSNPTLKPLNVESNQILNVLINNSSVNRRVDYPHYAVNSPLITTVKKPIESHAHKGLPPEQSTCFNNYDLSLQGSRLIGNPLCTSLNATTQTSDYLKKRPQDQTIDEWFYDYENAGG